RLITAMVAVSAASAFMVGGYEFVRISAASLFMERFGTANMPYAMTAVPFVMFAFIYLFARVLSRFGALKALLICMGVSCAVFLAAYAGAKKDMPEAIVLYYIFAEAYIVVLVEQFWSFINSSLSSRQAKLYNGPIAGGGAVGPMAAGYIAKMYSQRIGTENLILIAALVLIPAALLIAAAYKCAGEPKPAQEEKGGREGHLHLSLIFSVKPLMYLMGIIFLSQVFSTVLNLKFYQILENTITTTDARSAFLGSFWMKVNGAAVFLQFIGTPFALKWLSSRTIMAGLPLTHVCLAVLVFMYPSLETATLAFIVFKSTDYSVFRATKELFYIPLSFDARYRAKQIVDAFTYRFSKGVTAGSLSLLKAMGSAVPAAGYSVIAIIAAGMWLGLAFPLTAESKETI
ncbi:MAG: Npt1/Npt2 family nucleotide transporter, partial [Elusimicrobiaceae bacterium]